MGSVGSLVKTIEREATSACHRLGACSSSAHAISHASASLIRRVKSASINAATSFTPLRSL